MSFQTIGSQTIYSGRVFDIRLDQVRLPNGRQAQIDVVAHHGAVTVLPLDEMGRIWFIRQYRHPAGETILELPAGVTEEDEGPEASAQRELQEEIGMQAGRLHKLGEFFLAPGYSTEFMHVFLATGLNAAQLDADEDEFIEIEMVPAGQAYEMAHSGKIRDAKSLAALLLAQPYLKDLLDFHNPTGLQSPTD